MATMKSALSKDQEKQLLSLFSRVKLHLLHKASIHGFTANVFHRHCDNQGPTVIVAYNAAGFIYGAYTSKDYTQGGEGVNDEKTFLYSISAERNKPLRVSNPGTGFNFQAADMHGNDLTLTEQKQQLMKAILNYKPDIKTVHQARVLLVGPIGAGKSSFFNSINSAFRGNMTSQAIAGTAGESFRTYTIKAGKGGCAVPLILCDTMGLEEKGGLDIEDLVNIYKGHIKDRYQFSTSGPILTDAPGYQKHVTLSDRIHCVVYVVDTCKVSILSQKMLEKLCAIRRKTNQLGIPQLLLMTKVDEACPLVAEDLKNVYRSFYIQKKARELSEALGIPLSCILPVKNYSEELDLDQDTDTLLFGAVQHMLNFADSFFENQAEIQEGNDQMELYRSSDISRPDYQEHKEHQII
uniref:Interferon-induced protein 44-like n=1 Tax=Pundamilia nyererei TaxID=303518 RepID=A0A3B4G730_9CICH